MLDHGSVRAPTHLVPRKTFFPAQVLFRPRPAIINTTCTSLKFHSDSQAWWGSSEKENSKVGKGPPLLLGDDERHTHTKHVWSELWRVVQKEREREKVVQTTALFRPAKNSPAMGAKYLHLRVVTFLLPRVLLTNKHWGSRGPKKAPVRNRQDKQLKLFALQNIQWKLGQGVEKLV